MADSTRHQIMDAVIEALEGITKLAGYETTVKKVSEQWVPYTEMDLKDVPAIFPLDADESKEYISIGIGEDAVEAELGILCTCYVFDAKNDTRLKRTNMMRDVEKALCNNSAVDALIEFIEPGDVVTEKGSIQDWSIWEQNFKITYRYSSTAGG